MAIDSNLKQQMFLFVEQFKESGLSIKQFCEQNNLRYHSFHYWYKRYKQKDNQQTPLPLFKPVTIQPVALPGASGFADVTFPSGCNIRFFHSVSVDYLKALIK
jgi:hypothetical protein